MRTCGKGIYPTATCIRLTSLVPIFNNVDLRRTYLSEANVEGADLSWVKVKDTLADNVKFNRNTKLIGIDLNGINTNFALDFIAESRDQQRIAELERRHPAFARLLKITCDYGRSLWRWVGWSLAVLVVFASIYSLFPSLLHHPTDIVNRSDGLYFSVVTFTTLGYGDIYPATVIGKALVSAEVTLGYLMGGILIAILTKRVLG